MLLLKQDHISILEKQLNDVDAAETKLLFLGSSRKDGTASRTKILRKLEKELREHGEDDVLLKTPVNTTCEIEK